MKIVHNSHTISTSGKVAFSASNSSTSVRFLLLEYCEETHKYRKTNACSGNDEVQPRNWRAERTCSSLLDRLSCTPSSSLLLRTSLTSRPLVLYDLSRFSAGPFEAIFTTKQRRGLRTLLETISVYASAHSLRNTSVFFRIPYSYSWLEGEYAAECVRLVGGEEGSKGAAELGGGLSGMDRTGGGKK